MQIIGVAGMPGSGRKVLVRALAANRRWTVLSLGGLLGAEATRRGLRGTEPEKARISAQWRAAEGDDALVRRAVAAFERHPDPLHHRGLIVANVSRVAETEAIHQLVGRQIWIESAPSVRAVRLGVSDPATIRMVPAELSLVSYHADVFIENNGDDLIRFRRSAGRVLDADRCCAVEFD